MKCTRQRRERVPSSHPPLERARRRVAIGLATLDDRAIARAIVPDYVTNGDAPWLTALLAAREQFVGRTRGAWTERIAEGLPFNAPRRKLELALRVLDGLARDQVLSVVPARRIRAVLFTAAAATPDRAAALALASEELELSEAAMRQALFS